MEIGGEGQYEIFAFITEGLEADTVRWEIEIAEEFTANEADLADLPTSPVLYPARPNPFNSKTIIKLFSPFKDHIRVNLYDINGRKVKSILDKKLVSGEHSLVLLSKDLSAGVYFLEMNSSKDFQTFQRIVVLK